MDTVRYPSFMSSPGERGSPSDRVRQHAETRALNEAKKVPWRLLANAAHGYTEWQVFGLWLRAVLDCCEELPAEVANEVETRSRALLSHLKSELGTLEHPRGNAAWEAVTDWSESTVFAEAKRNRWLNAVRYFSSRSLSSVKAWSYWETIHRQWQDESPAPLPTYQEWTGAISAFSRLSNPESEAQKVLDSIRLIPEAAWQSMFDAFTELMALCLWIEIVLGTRMGTAIVARELKARHPKFDISLIQNSERWISALTDWVIVHELPFADTQPPLSALAYHTKSHPAYYARRNYAARCRAFWSAPSIDRLPSFEEWRDAADEYFES